MVGSHLDSVPQGGWLDGALGVMAGVGVLREAAGRGTPERTVALVDWADEEGARFGRSLLGSSAFAGTLDIEAVRGLTDADGVSLPDALAGHGVRARADGRGRGGPCASACTPTSSFTSSRGPCWRPRARRARRWRGRWGSSATGSCSPDARPTPARRRWTAAVTPAWRRRARSWGSRRSARRPGGVSTAGRLDLAPGVVTVVPGRAELLTDLRHLDARMLAEMLAEARRLAEDAAAQEGCSVSFERILALEPVPFHPGLVEAAGEACLAAGGSSSAVPSGALHDASEIARVAPTAMIFAPSKDGVSHAPEEDTPDADLHAAITAFGALAQRVIEDGVPLR